MIFSKGLVWLHYFYKILQHFFQTMITCKHDPLPPPMNDFLKCFFSLWYFLNFFLGWMLPSPSVNKKIKKKLFYASQYTSNTFFTFFPYLGAVHPLLFRGYIETQQSRIISSNYFDKITDLSFPKRDRVW